MIESMQLTEEQKRRLEKQSPEMLLAIMHECAGILAAVSVDEYSQIMATPKRTVYQQISAGKLKCFAISKHKFPIVNER